MKNSYKKYLLIFSCFLGTVWKLIPNKISRTIIFSLMVITSRSKSPDVALRELFYLEEKLSLIINERAIRYGFGEHPKHRLTSYHNFFIDNIIDGGNVLDIGCGYGAVARSIAINKPNSIVLGIDNNKERLDQAIKSNNPSNLSYSLQDITEPYPNLDWTYIVLSNVLEHIDNRIETLMVLRKQTKAQTFLIRVPSFERHWSVALRKELDINYFQDDDHKIEHTVSQFTSEIHMAGLKLLNLTTIWGEIWAICLSEKYD